jgi:hypothetical protein
MPSGSTCRAWFLACAEDFLPAGRVCYYLPQPVPATLPVSRLPASLASPSACVLRSGLHGHIPGAFCGHPSPVDCGLSRPSELGARPREARYCWSTADEASSLLRGGPQPCHSVVTVKMFHAVLRRAPDHVKLLCSGPNQIPTQSDRTDVRNSHVRSHASTSTAAG